MNIAQMHSLRLDCSVSYGTPSGEYPFSLLKTGTPALSISLFLQNGYYTDSPFSRISSYHFILHASLKFSPCPGESSASVSRGSWARRRGSGEGVINTPGIKSGVSGGVRHRALYSRNVFVP